MVSQSSFFWHDYETFGADARRDRPCQFAGVRTDLDFNVIDDPLMVYCRISDDYLPHPQACLITGITPQLTLEKGVCEAEFARQIHAQLAEPATCGVGYNSLRFDDEFTRNLLYRNFYDPYGREWQNGNSRWDLIDLVRATYALRPEGIEWPINDEGLPSFRLELLTQANGLQHEAAHDALSDVYATIALARLIKQKQPRLYDYCLQHRQKNVVSSTLKLGSYTPLVHVSGMFGARNHCLAIVLPLAQHPTNSNEVIVFDLSQDPGPLLELDVEQIRQRLFTRSEDLPEGEQRIALKTIHVNRSPVVAELKVLRPVDLDRLQLDIPQCLRHAEQLQAHQGLVAKLDEVFSRTNMPAETDVDLMLYSGFFAPQDKAIMQRITEVSQQQIDELKPHFKDPRLPELWLRYRARNYPETLNNEERQHWQQLCEQRRAGAAGFLSLTDYQNSLQNLLDDHPQSAVLQALNAWQPLPHGH